ncbi:MAG: radical SAM protein [Endomicrobia bacterium]|nr:radical SAM protein [Endomicrobiia bacterium]
MKIAIIFPPFRHRKFSENLKVVDEEFTLSPPIILAYVAAIAEQAGHDVILIDAHALKLTKEQVLLRITNFRADLLAFRVETYNFPETLRWIQYLKVSTGKPVLVGGINMDLYPLETMSHKEIDFGLAGEVIHTLPEFLKCLENNKSFSHIPGLYWRDDNTGEVKFNPAVKNTVDFDLYPYPARNLLPNEVYHSFVSQHKNFTIMLTQTGCPYRCKFCAIAAIKHYRKPAYRKRSWEKVVKEIEQCYYDYGIREIDIFDATFFIDKDRDIKICQEIRKRGIKIEWTCRSRVDIVDEDILKEAALAGCRMIFWGIESGSQNVLDAVNKDIKLEQTFRAIKLARKYGIRNLGFLMIGNPKDTVATIKQTIKFAKKLDLDYVQICRTIAKPSTELHKELIELTGRDYWREYTIGTVEDERIPVPWSSLTQKKVEELLKFAYYSFYFRPLFVLKTIMKTKSVEELLRYVKVGIRMLFHYFYTDVIHTKLVKKIAHMKIYEPIDNKGLTSLRYKNVYIILPAYDENENLLILLKKLFLLYPEFKVVLIDSTENKNNSAFVTKLTKIYNIDLLKVPKETLGNERGKAVKIGFKYALEKGADIIIEMDADMSHRPEYINELLKWINEYDVVIGSRYIKGAFQQGSLFRKILSFLANIYIRYSLGIKDVIDCTSGFRCYRRDALEELALEYIRSTEGTAVLIETLYFAVKKKLKIKEVPIIYYERLFGKSKFSLRTIVESLKLVSKLSKVT